MAWVAIGKQPVLLADIFSNQDCHKSLVPFGVTHKKIKIEREMLSL